MFISTLIALTAMTAPGDTACSATPTTATGQKDIVATAIAAGDFKTLAAALTAADLVGTLQGAGPFTVFAPTDAAFARLPAGTVENLLKPENRKALQDLLTYHVVSGKVPASAVVKLPGAMSVEGQRLPINVDEGVVTVAGARVVKTDILCSNGIIHVIDAVMMPATDSIVGLAAKAGTFNTLLAAAKAAGLAETLASDGPFTVLAPTDEAFAKLPAGTVENLLKPGNKDQLVAVLKAHVISGRAFSDQVATMKDVKSISGYELKVDARDGVRIGGARVVAADLQATNGVVHVIDTVIVPQ